MAKMKRGPQFEARPFFSGQHPVIYVHGVLQMRKSNAFLEDEVANVIRPNRKSVFESELAQKIRALQIELTAGAFFAAE